MSLPTPYYQDDSVTIYHGDCRVILPDLPKVDLVITSPPYDGLRIYGGHSFEWESVVPLVAWSIVKGGVVVWNVGDETTDGSESATSFRQVLKFMEWGLNLHDTMIYEKPNFSNPSHNRYHQLFEFMFVFSNGSPKTFNPICDKRNAYGTCWGKNTFREKDGSMNCRAKNKPREFGMRGNVWRMNTAGQETICKPQEHPAPMPYRMAADQMLSWSSKESSVMDPMCGGGTTLRAAKDLGRKSIGIEIEERYCEIAAKRMAQEVLQF